MKTSTTPSLSMSAKARAAPPNPTPLRPNGLAVEPPEKSGVVSVPVFWKKIVLPFKLPMNASKSLSPSISINLGAELAPTLVSPYGLVVEFENLGDVADPTFS